MLQKSGMSTYFYNYQMEIPGKATATRLLLLWETGFLWDIYDQKWDQVTCRRWNKWIITSSDGTDLKTFLLLIRNDINRWTHFWNKMSQKVCLIRQNSLKLPYLLGNTYLRSSKFLFQAQRSKRPKTTKQKEGECGYSSWSIKLGTFFNHF